MMVDRIAQRPAMLRAYYRSHDMTMAKVGSEFGCSTREVHRILHRGAFTKHNRSDRDSRSLYNTEICDRYLLLLNGPPRRSLAEVARIEGVTSTTIYNHVSWHPDYVPFKPETGGQSDV